MPRVYLSNDSYPELRDLTSQWARTVTWWRAIGHAARHGDFWGFVAVQAFLAVGAVAVAEFGSRLVGLAGGPIWLRGVVLTVPALVLLSYLQVSWGGDMMRRHLRAVSDVARYACPRCGHSLFGHLGGPPEILRCPECAENVERTLFSAPFRVPRRFRAFPPRRGA